MKSRIWIILAILLICNVLGYAVLMADSEAKAAALSAWGKATSAVSAKAAAAPMSAAAAFATITVNTRTDEGDYDLVMAGYQGTFANTTKCSLREAIRSAETNTAIGGCVAGATGVTDRIEISLPSLAGDPLAGGNDEIDIERVLPAITTDMEIVGGPFPLPGGVTIGNPAANVFQRSHAGGVPNFRVLTIEAGATVSLKGITLCNGLGNDNGIALKNSGTVTMDTVDVFDNNIPDDIAAPIGNGTIHNDGTLTMINCDVLQNRAGHGGGIFNSNILNVDRSIISSNASTVSASRYGGGLYNFGGTVTMSNSAIRANEADKGGGIYNVSGTVTLTNCSLSENSASTHGAGIYVEFGTVNLRSVTIAGHGAANGTAEHDAAIFLDVEAELNYRNTIFGNGMAVGAFTITNLFNLNDEGFPVSEGHNISNDASVPLGGLGDLSETDPMIETIGTYGSPTENPSQIDTFRLRCGSPAIDAAWSSGASAAPTTDARGVARYDAPDIAPNGSNFPDIGSHEFDYRIITASTLPAYTVGTFYTVTLEGRGGETPYFWLRTIGSLPAGLTLNNLSGVISGTPTASGTSSFTISLQPNEEVYDNCVITKQFTLTGSGGGGGCGAVTIALPNLNAMTCDTSFSQTLVATGGTAPYTYSLESGTLPTGLSLVNGVLSGTPTVPGPFNFTLRATDANTCTNTRAYSVTVGCPTVTVTPPAVTTATNGQFFTRNFTSNKANAGYTLALGTLPTGVTLSVTGTLSGTPTQNGSFPITVTATVGTVPNTCSGTSATYTLVVGCPTITIPTPATLNALTCDTAFVAQTMTASGGATPYSYSVVAGSLPAGLSLAPNGATAGQLSGTPTVPGAFSFTVRATDANGCIGDRAFSGSVACPIITVGAPGVATATTGVAFSRNFSSSKANSVFTLASGTLPNGVTLSSAGVLSGTPTQSGSFPITVKATVGTCNGTSATYTLVVTCPTITIPTPATLNALVCDTAFVAQTMTASGSTAAYSYAVSAGSLPTGLTLSTAGLLSGTPTVPGAFSFTVRATDANGCTGERAFSGSVACPTITVNPSSAALSATQGTAYSQTFTSSKAGATMSLTGTLPTGLSFANGVLSGTPTQSGVFNNITVTATAGTCVGSRVYMLTVTSNNTAPTFGTAQTVARQKGSPAGSAVTIAMVNDAQSSAGSLTVTQISDPAATATGITVTNITNTNGTITASVAASCNATAGTVCLQVSDGTLTTKGTFTVTLTNNSAPVLTYNPLATVSQGVSSTVNPATGPSDNGSISSIVLQSVTPAAPNGAITVNNTTGVVTVNSTLPIGYYTVTVRATDNCGTTTDASFTLNVIGSLLVSEFALSGPNGQNDWFVELYNNTNVAQNTAGLQLGIVNTAGLIYATYNLDLVAPITIAPRSYYLVKGSNASLTGVTADYTAIALANGFVSAGVAICKGDVSIAANRLDSAGMSNLPNGHFYVEPAPLAWLNSTLRVHSFVRNFNSAGFPIDTNVNSADFRLVAPDTAAINGATPLLGLPGPQGSTSPAVNNAGMPVALLKTGIAATTWPNAEVVTEAGVGTTRSLYLRRAVTNSTGAPVKKLRFRIVEMSTGGVGIANLRAQTSLNATLTVDGLPVAVKGLQLEDAASQPNGGGINSTLCEGTITLAQPLAAGAKVNVQFRLGVVSGGSYRFVANVEAQN